LIRCTVAINSSTSVSVISRSRMCSNAASSVSVLAGFGCARRCRPAFDPLCQPAGRARSRSQRVTEPRGPERSEPLPSRPAAGSGVHQPWPLPASSCPMPRLRLPLALPRPSAEGMRSERKSTGCSSGSLKVSVWRQPPTFWWYDPSCSLRVLCYRARTRRFDDPTLRTSRSRWTHDRALGSPA
jgi:hypothetical protein